MSEPVPAEHPVVVAPPDPGKSVVYCGVCTMPPEFCEFGGTVPKCRVWLQKNHPEMFEDIWSEEALEAATASLSLEAQERAAKDAKKKAAKAQAADLKQASKLSSSKVIIKRIERNKRKFVTSITGLEGFSLQLKTVSKELGKKFATGASVSKVPGGGEEIVVQGDLSDDIREFLVKKYEAVSDDCVELVEDKKKKGGAAAAEAAEAEGGLGSSRRPGR